MEKEDAHPRTKPIVTLEKHTHKYQELMSGGRMR